MARGKDLVLEADYRLTARVSYHTSASSRLTRSHAVTASALCSGVAPGNKPGSLSFRIKQAVEMNDSFAHLTMHAGVVPSLCVFWPIVPKQTHHHLSCGTKQTGVNQDGADKDLFQCCLLHNGYMRPPPAPSSRGLVLHGVQYFWTGLGLLPDSGSCQRAEILATKGRVFFLGPDLRRTVSLTRITSPSRWTPWKHVLSTGASSSWGHKRTG